MKKNICLEIQAQPQTDIPDTSQLVHHNVDISDTNLNLGQVGGEEGVISDDCEFIHDNHKFIHELYDNDVDNLSEVSRDIWPISALRNRDIGGLKTSAIVTKNQFNRTKIVKVIDDKKVSDGENLNLNTDNIDGSDVNLTVNST